MHSAFQEELLRLRLLHGLRLRQLQHLHRRPPRLANIDPNCHGNCESNGDCHSHRFRQSDAYAQTDAYCQAAGDAEAAPDSAAAPGRAAN